MNSIQYDQLPYVIKGQFQRSKRIRNASELMHGKPPSAQNRNLSGNRIPIVPRILSSYLIDTIDATASSVLTFLTTPLEVKLGDEIFSQGS